MTKVNVRQRKKEPVGRAQARGDTPAWPPRRAPLAPSTLARPRAGTSCPSTCRRGNFPVRAGYSGGHFGCVAQFPRALSASHPAVFYSIGGQGPCLLGAGRGGGRGVLTPGRPCPFREPGRFERGREHSPPRVSRTPSDHRFRSDRGAGWRWTPLRSGDEPDAAGIPLQRPGRLHQQGGRLPGARLHTRAHHPPGQTALHIGTRRCPGHCVSEVPYSGALPLTPRPRGFRAGAPRHRLGWGQRSSGFPPRGHGIRDRFPGPGSAGLRPVARSRRIVVWIYQTMLSRICIKP